MQSFFTPYRATANKLARVDPPTTGEKKKVYQFRQPCTKKFGKTGLQVPVPQQLRIIEKHMRGASIRQIAEKRTVQGKR
jgi:hypothetical protein